MHYDIQGRKSYADFIKTTEGVKPYKNSRSWPLGLRKYSQKHFVLREDGTIDIFFVNRKTRELVEKKVDDSHSDWVRKRNLATVHPNNTVSFNKKLWTSDGAFLSRVFPHVHIRRNERMGGAVLTNSRLETYPMFKDCVFSLDDFKLLTPVNIFQHTVNRKKVNEGVKLLDEFHKVWPALLGAMRVEDIVAITEELGKNSETLPTKHKHMRFMELVEKKHYVDAALLYAANNSSVSYRMWRIFRNAETTSEIVEVIKESMDINMRRVITLGHDAFDKHKVPVGTLPESRWELSVFHYCNLVERL